MLSAAFGQADATKLHADEVEMDEGLVRRLLSAQFPRWAQLPLTRVPSDGTDNIIYRLGDTMSVRLPRTGGSDGQAIKEHEWLPRLAPLLPLDVPVPLGLGTPDPGYPWHWSVRRWLVGETATPARLVDPGAIAVDLAGFLTVLHGVDAAGGPGPGPHNFFRGVPLAHRDAAVQAALAEIGDLLDVHAARAVWRAALEAPSWSHAPVWVHGDLQAGNLLLVDGRLGAVIDWGGLGVGDPACDVMAAWTVLPPEAREDFRSQLRVDDATWARARGWVLSMALIALPYYRDRSPVVFRKAMGWAGAALENR